MPDGSFAVADALKDARVVQDGFKSRAEAEKFIEDYYLARGTACAICRARSRSPMPRG